MRLFFLQGMTLSLGAGGSLTYQAGHFYIVDDPAEARGFLASGAAETEETHEARLAHEAAVRAQAEAEPVATQEPQQ